MEQAEAEELIQRLGQLLEQTQKVMESSQATLARLQTFEGALTQLQTELASHDQQLQAILSQLRQQAALAEARPPSAFVDPHPFPWEVAGEKEAEGTSQLPAPPVHAPDRPERRSAVRRSGNLVSIILRKSQSEEKTASGWVLDRSLGGLGLLVDAPAQAGDTLLVRPTTAADDVVWVGVEVRYCMPLGSSWRLGCRFVGQPSWDQVRLFG